MNDFDDLSQGLALLRMHAMNRANLGQVIEAHGELMRACIGLLDEFRTVYNPPGVRYWETYLPDGTRRHCTTMVGVESAPVSWRGNTVELAHHEYLSRQNIFDDARDEL